MRNQIPEKLIGLSDALQDNKANVVNWLQNNLSIITQDDLLKGNGSGCPCGSCHGSQFGLFRKVLGMLDDETFRLLLKEQFDKYPDSISLPEMAYILVGWMMMEDTQYILNPFPEINPATGIKHIDTLSPAARERMENHWVYIDAVNEMKAIVETLLNFGVTENQLESYRIHCHDRWLSSYKILMAPDRPGERGETFEDRFALFMESPQFRLHYYFDYHEDKDLLLERLLAKEFRDIIPKAVAMIPKRMVSWNKWGKRLLTRYHRNSVI